MRVFISRSRGQNTFIIERTPVPPDDSRPAELKPADPFESILVSDADRDRACAILRDNFASGRLTEDEFQQRTDRTLKARRAAELEAALTGLPGPDFIRQEYAERPAAEPQRRVAGWVAPLLSVPALLATSLMLLGLVAVLPANNPNGDQGNGWTTFWVFLVIAAVLWGSVWGLVKQRRWARGVATAASVLLGLTLIGIVIAVPALVGLWNGPRVPRND